MINEFFKHYKNIVISLYVFVTVDPTVTSFDTETRSKDFASWTVHFVNIYVKNQQMLQLLFNLLVMYGGSNMFRHCIAILRERS
jgi:hypothetical protein